MRSTWRTGTRNPHTLYVDEHPVGFVLNPPVAERIARSMNALEEMRQLIADPKTTVEQCFKKISHLCDYARDGSE